MAGLHDYEDRLIAQDRLIQLKQRQAQREQELQAMELQRGQNQAAVDQDRLFTQQGLGEIEASRAFQESVAKRNDIFTKGGMNTAYAGRGLAQSGIREGGLARQTANTLQQLAGQNLTAQQQAGGLQREAAVRQADILAQLSSLEARRRALMTGPV